MGAWWGIRMQKQLQDQRRGHMNEKGIEKVLNRNPGEKYWSIKDKLKRFGCVNISIFVSLVIPISLNGVYQKFPLSEQVNSAPQFRHFR